MSFLKKISDILHHTTSCELPAESKQSGAPTHDVSGNGVPSSLRYEVSDDHIVITGCSAKEISVVIPAEIEGLPVTIINSTSFAQHKLIKKIVIPDSVTLIGSLAFLESGLTSVKMSRSITFIASGAFKNCTELTDITFPDALQKIGPEAFNGCKSLKRIVLPASLKELVDTSIFANCTDLRNFQEWR
ncbi:MAG: leucine-rich repeat domain-containing protein [Ruminococcus sp.]|nr:leucine-rich repeat domain-containing protein [Ruminococcus sp.]